MLQKLTLNLPALKAQQGDVRIRRTTPDEQTKGEDEEVGGARDNLENVFSTFMQRTAYCLRNTCKNTNESP